MKTNRLDITVAIFAGLACYSLVAHMPPWAIFFGWAWYFALGAKPQVFKQAIPPMLLGYALSSIAVLAFTASGGKMIALAVTVAITIFIVMLSLKVGIFSCSLASFNAYSCMFAGYYSGSFPKMAESMAFDINNVLICAAWMVVGNVIGLGIGYLCIAFGIGAQKA